MQVSRDRQLYQQSQEEIVSFVDFIPKQQPEQDHKWRIKSQLDHSQERFYINTGHHVKSQKSIINDIKNIPQQIIKTTSIMDSAEHSQTYHQQRILKRAVQHINLHQKTFTSKIKQEQAIFSTYKQNKRQSSINYLSNINKNKSIQNRDNYYKNQRIKILQQIHKDMNISFPTRKYTFKEGLNRKSSQKKIIIHQIANQLKSKSCQKILVKPHKEIEVKAINYLEFQFQVVKKPQKNIKKKWLQTKNQIKEAINHISPKIIPAQSSNNDLTINTNTNEDLKSLQVKQTQKSNNIPINNDINLNNQLKKVPEEEKNSQNNIFTFSKIKNQHLFSFNNINMTSQSLHKHTKNVSIEISQHNSSQNYKQSNTEMVIGCIYCGILKKRCNFH